MDKCCHICGKLIRRIGGKYYRMLMTSKVYSPYTAEDGVKTVLQGEHISRSKYACDLCFNLLRRWGRKRADLDLIENEIRHLAGKEKLNLDPSPVIDNKRKSMMSSASTSNPNKKARIETTEQAKAVKFKSDAARFLKISRYQRVFTLLTESSKSANRDFTTVLQRKIRKEISRGQIGCFAPLKQKVTLQSLAEFDWGDLVANIRKECPSLFSVVQAMTMSPSEQRDEEWSHKVPAIGNLIAIALSLRKANAFTFVKAMMVVQMKRNGANSEVIDTFNHLHLCASYTTALRTLRNLCHQQESLQNLDTETTGNDQDNSANYENSKTDQECSDLSESNEESDEASEIEDDLDDEIASDQDTVGEGDSESEEDSEQEPAVCDGAVYIDNDHETVDGNDEFDEDCKIIFSNG